MDDEKLGGPAEPKSACPICGKPRLEVYKPFCSRRCADVDLGRWLKGAYAVPADSGEEPPSPEESEDS